MSGRHEELLGRALAGDESAFVALLDLLEQPVYAYFRRRRVSAEDAEDLTQAVFMALLQRGSSFDASRGHVRGFVFGIARRTWLKHAAQAGRAMAAVSTDLVDPTSESPEISLYREERRTAIAQAIEELPETARDVLTLRLHQDLSIAEIAQAMSLAENTVKSHLFRARSRLRESVGSKLDMKEGD